MKKLFCGMLAIMLVFSIFAACGETENLTNSTTDNEFKKEDLNDYVGYWYVDEQSMNFDKEETDSYADVQWVYISQVYETQDERAIAVEVYDGTLIYPEYHSRYSLEDDSNVAILPSYYADKGNYRLEFKDGKIIFSSGENVDVTLNYKTSDETAYEAIIDHNSKVFEHHYKGYWYMGNMSEEPDSFDELHIKSFDSGILTFDYSYGDKHGENMTAELRKDSVRFAIDDELTGILYFNELSDYITFSVATPSDSGYAYSVGGFAKSIENLPDTYRPFMWRQRERIVMENGVLKSYQYDESTATWLTFSKTDYETEREAVKEWLKEDLDSIKSAMGEDYVEPVIYIAKCNMDYDETEDFLVWIMHFGFTGSAGSPLSVMYFDGMKVIGEEYIAHFRLDADTLESEGNKQIGIFPYGKYWHDISVLGNMYVCDLLYRQ